MGQYTEHTTHPVELLAGESRHRFFEGRGVDWSASETLKSTYVHMSQSPDGVHGPTSDFRKGRPKKKFLLLLNV